METRIVPWLALLPGAAFAGPWGSTSLVTADTLVEGYTYDQLGTDVVSGDLNGDGVLDLVISSAQPGDERVFVYFGPVPAGTLSRSDADLVIVGEPGSAFGRSLAVGNLLGGGTDLAIGAPNQDDLGAVFLFEGPLAGGTLSSGDAAHRVDGSALAPGERPMTGFSVAAANVDGVGLDELVVGAPAARFGNGDVYVISDVIGQSTVGGGHLINTGMFGWSVADAGDLNGDGTDEIAIGAPLEGTGGTNAGMVVLFYGHPDLMKVPFDTTTARPPSLRSPSTIPIGYAQILGSSAGDNLGWSVAGGGDLNSDGYDDLLIGAPGLRGGVEGAASAILGGADRGPDILLDRVIAGTSDVDRLRGIVWHGPRGVGVDVAGAGDTSPNLLGAELLVGSTDDGAWLLPWTMSLQVNVFTYRCEVDPDTGLLACLGPFPLGGTSPSKLSLKLGNGLEGHFTSPYGLPAGAVVAGLGDVSGDGVDDLGFGEPIFQLWPDVNDEPAVCTEPALCAGKVAVVNGRP